ncbi:MAG: adenylate/guanylate cyclase domain-containing protein [Bacteroidales bacterium]|jgi:class 3 adenylate cyclase
MIKRLFILLFFILFLSFSYSQTNKIDSLLKVLVNEKEDTSRVNILNDLYRQYQFSDWDTAFAYAEKALALAESSGFQRGIGSSLNNIGFYYFNNGKSSIALEYYLKANDIFSQIEYKRGKAIVLANIGYLFSSQNNFKKAIDYYFLSMAVAREMSDSSRVLKLLSNIGLIYYYQGDYSQALDLFLKALKISESMHNKKEIAYVYGNIGLIYETQKSYQKSLEYYFKSLALLNEIGDKKGFAGTLSNIGTLYTKLKDNKKAIDNLLLALKIYTEIDDADGMSTSLLNLGDYYHAQKDYSKALEYYLKADKLNIELKDKNAQANALGLVGDIYYEQNNYSNALISYQQSISIAEEHGLKELLKVNYQEISKVYEKMGNIKEALNYQKKYSNIKDSIYNDESAKQIAEMQTTYETEKKEKEIKLLKKESEVQSLKISRGSIIIYSIIGILVLIIILTLVTYKAYRNNKKAKQILQTQNKEITLQKEQITQSRTELEKEKQKSEVLLQNILPIETAEELKHKGYATVRHYENVSIMFTDFVGFTKITEKLTPVELVSELNNFFIQFDDITGKYNLEKIKTIGDSYMCAGGLHSQDISNPKKTILAALEILKFVNECNEEKLKWNQPLWEIRIGIHTGDIIAGVVGKKKFAYDIWGDSVNTASRMESSGEVGKINISGSTYEHIKDFFDCTYRGKIPAKNKQDIDMYFVEGIKKGKMVFQEDNQPFQRL